MTTSIGTDTVTVEWTVSTITFPPETYVVQYGTSTHSLELESDPIESENNTSSYNVTYSMQLSSLLSNTLYYYQVISMNLAVNIENSTASSLKQFKTKQGRRSVATFLHVHMNWK